MTSLPPDAAISLERWALGRHLLWFRPDSVLDYALPTVLANMAWSGHTHLPIDSLTLQVLEETQWDTLNLCSAWFLTSPTAAHCLAVQMGHLSRHLDPKLIAVVGTATRKAWQSASKFEPKDWVASATGDSMGLYINLREHINVAIVRAQAGREDLPNALRAQGVQVHFVASYQKSKNLQWELQLQAQLESRPLTQTVLCLTSSDQVCRFDEFANKLFGDFRLGYKQDLRLVVSHERVGWVAKALGYEQIIQIRI